MKYEGKYVTFATVTSWCEFYKACTEHKIAFRRPYTLTERGIQRMLDKGCPETDDEPRQNWSVVRVEHMVYA